MPRLLPARLSFSRQHISSTAECDAADSSTFDVLSGPCKLPSIDSGPYTATNRGSAQLRNSGRRSNGETEPRFLAQLTSREYFPASAVQKNSCGRQNR